MGGNALGVQSKRLTNPEFNKLKTVIVDKLVSRIGQDLPQGFRVANPPSYRTKESHGDLDLVVNYQITPQHITEWFGISLANIAHNSHNMTLSFLYDGFQVDIIRTSPEAFDAILWYLSYNDLNALIGRVATWQGLNYGLQGLFIKVGHKNNPAIQLEAILTTSVRRAYELLGYDFDRAQKGFDTPNDIFDFVVSSPYFSAGFFPFDRNTSTRATRDRKRKMYVDFLEYLRVNAGNFQVPQKIELNDIPEYVGVIDDLRCRLNKVYDKAVARAKFTQAVDAIVPKASQNAVKARIFNGEPDGFKDTLMECQDFESLARGMVEKYNVGG